MEEFNYKWTGFSVQIIDNSGMEPVISENRQVDKKALGLRISMHDTVFVIARRGNAAGECYATSCGQDYTRLHNISSISIKTLNDYSDQFPADVEVTSLFKARLAEDTKKDYTSISNMIEQINSMEVQLYSQLTSNFDLYLMDTTCKGGKQVFEIIFTLTDGNVLTRQTDEITLH